MATSPAFASLTATCPAPTPPSGTRTAGTTTWTACRSRPAATTPAVTVQPLFDEAAERLLSEHPDVRGGRMFASEGLKTGDRFFAMVSKGDLVLKLPEDRVDELVAGGAAPFKVGGRRMREWVRVQPQDTRACADLMREARAFVKG